MASQCWRSARCGRVTFHWQHGKIEKPMDRAWPFVAVLEYEGRGKPEAFVDWFRRDRGSRSDGAWVLDPSLGYAEHINKIAVCHQDERWCYMALVDTPTGRHVGGLEIVVRGRVRWADGRRVQKGWWLWLEAPDGKGPEVWRAPSTPLVDWRVTGTTDSLGIVATAPVADPDHELAVWGTDTVFRLPDVPATVMPCRGRG